MVIFVVFYRWEGFSELGRMCLWLFILLQITDKLLFLWKLVFVSKVWFPRAENVLEEFIWIKTESEKASRSILKVKEGWDAEGLRSCPHLMDVVQQLSPAALMVSPTRYHGDAAEQCWLADGRAAAPQVPGLSQKPEDHDSRPRMSSRLPPSTWSPQMVTSLVCEVRKCSAWDTNRPFGCLAV